MSKRMSRLVLLSFLGIAAAQIFVPQPPGFNLVPVSSTNPNNPSGSFVSHASYLRQPYAPGTQTRFVVTVPQGQKVTFSLDMTNAQNFQLRSYDFAVMFDGSLAGQLTQPCNTSSYVALGARGTAYQSIVMSDISASRTFTTQSNVAVVDFCVNKYNSGFDTSMMGFQINWSAQGGSNPPAPVPTIPPVNPTPAPSSAGCGRPSVPPSTAIQNTRIVGGVTSPANSWPWACALIQNGFQFCDCSIVNSQWVVTAGHCTEDTTESAFTRSVTVYYGSQNLRTAQKSSIIRMIRHPQYDTPSGTTSNDVALLKLASPIPSFPNANVAPVCLPNAALGTFTPQATGNFGRSIAYVAGWGTTAEGQTSSSAAIGSGSDQLLQTTVEVYSRQDCVNAFGSSLQPSTFCAGLNNGGRDSCQGDSGGPLVEPQADGSYALFGIVSFGEGCARAGHPGAYSDVFYLKPWITQTIASN